MKYWHYRVWFDRDTNEVSLEESDGTIIKEQTDQKKLIYLVELSEPLSTKIWINSNDINVSKPKTDHVPGDDYCICSEGIDYYSMGITYSEDEPLPAVVTKKSQCKTMCNKEVIKTLEERKTEIEKAISRLNYLNHFGGNEDA